MRAKPTHWPLYVEVCPDSWSTKLPDDWGTQCQQTLLHAEDDRDNACLQYKGFTGESTLFNTALSAHTPLIESYLKHCIVP